MAHPTSYNPAHCETATELLRQGYSIAAVAGSIGVCRATIYTWLKEYPDFAQAVAIGQAGAILWWEQQNRTLAKTGEGNAASIIFGLKNRAADEWRDISRQEQTGANGGPIERVDRIELVGVRPDGDRPA